MVKAFDKAWSLLKMPVTVNKPVMPPLFFGADSPEERERLVALAAKKPVFMYRNQDLAEHNPHFGTSVLYGGLGHPKHELEPIPISEYPDGHPAKKIELPYGYSVDGLEDYCHMCDKNRHFNLDDEEGYLCSVCDSPLGDEESHYPEEEQMMRGPPEPLPSDFSDVYENEYLMNPNEFE